MSDLDIRLILRLVDQVSGPARQADRALGRIEERTGRARGAITGAAKLGLVAVAGAAVTAAGAATASVGSAIKMQDAWSEANKTLELSPVALERFKGEINELSADLPIARAGLVDIAAVAGQLGIRGSADILAFTEDAAKMAATFDVSAGAAAEMMGQWRSQMGYTQDEARQLADQINFLGNTTAADSASIASFATNVIGLATNAGMAEAEVLALGAAMVANGAAPEIAATGLRALIRTMTESVDSMSSAETAVLEQIGLFEQWGDIQKQFSTDSEGAIRRVTDAISTLETHEQANAITKLFGDEANRSMGAFLGNVERMDGALGRISSIEAAEGSMLKEFEALSQDVVDNWQRVQNALGARSEGFGAGFLDPINDGLKGALNILTTLDERATVFDKMGAGWTGFMAGLGDGAALSAVAEKIDAIQNAVHAFLFGTTDGDAGEALAGIFRRAQEAGEGVKAVVEQVQTGWTALKQMLEDSGAIEAAASYLDGVVTALTGLGDFAWTALTEGATGFMEGFGSVQERFQPVFEAFGKVWSSLGGLLTDVGSGLSSLSGNEDAIEVLNGMGRAVGFIAGLALDGVAATLTLVSGAIETIRGIGQGDMEAALAPVRALFDWLRSLDVGGLLPDIDAASVIDTIAGWFNFTWADILPTWDWSAIIPDMPDLGAFFGGEETIFDRLRDANGDGVFDIDWNRGKELVDQLEAGAISHQQMIDELNTALLTGSGNAREEADRMLGVLRDASEAALAVEAAPVTVAQIAADTAQIEAIGAKIEEASAIAAALPREVAAAIAAAEREANLDLRPAGEAAARSFAAGIRAGTPEAVAAARAMARAVSAETTRGTVRRRSTALHDGADHDL